MRFLGEIQIGLEADCGVQFTLTFQDKELVKWAPRILPGVSPEVIHTYARTALTATDTTRNA